MWATLISMAVMVGLDRLVNKFDRMRLESKKVNIASILGDLQAIITAAQQKGSSVLNNIVGQMNSLPTYLSGSSEVKKLIHKTKQNLKNKYDSVEKKVNEDINKYNSLLTEANQMSMDPDYVKDTDRLQQIQKEINNFKEVEQNVTSKKKI